MRKSTLIRYRPIQGESNIDFLGGSEGSPSPLPQDSTPDNGEARNDSWSMSGNFIYRHHVEPREKATSMIVGISTEQEICLILGQVSLSLRHKVRNLQKDIYGPGGD